MRVLHIIGENDRGNIGRYAKALFEDLKALREGVQSQVLEGMEVQALVVRREYGLGRPIPAAVHEHIRATISGGALYLGRTAKHMADVVSVADRMLEAVREALREESEAIRAS
jgi:hypothetical protein